MKLIISSITFMVIRLSLASGGFVSLGRCNSPPSTIKDFHSITTTFEMDDFVIHRKGNSTMIYLDRSACGIHSISHTIFLGGYGYLSYLNFKSNNITFIHPGAFVLLFNLKFLNLSHNPIQKLPRELFYSLPKLDTILLSFTQLEIFDVRFRNDTDLVELALCYNKKLTFITQVSFQGLWNLRSLYLIGNGFTTFQQNLFYNLTNLIAIYLDANDLQRFDVNFHDESELLLLSMCDNRNLNSIGENTLKKLTHLQYLYLDNCGFTAIPKDLFYDLVKLESLVLRDNYLKTFDVTFRKGTALQEIFLSMKSLERMNPESFENLDNLTSIHTRDFWLCCAQNVGEKNQQKCKPEKFTLSSCDDLIRYEGLRIFVWVMGFAATLGNLAVIAYRLLLERERNTTYKIFVGHLSVSDLMMGVYLLIIASVDESYRDIYGGYEVEWRQSLLCKISGFLSTMSSETSAIFIFLITLDRFLVTKFPFGGIRFNAITIRLSCAFAWLTSFVLALIPFLPVPPFQDWEMYSSNDMCVGLPLSVTRLKGWGYSVAIFVGLNFLLFLLIAFGQIAICWTFVRNRPNITSPTFARRRRQQEIAVARSLSLIVVSDFLCWFPIGVLGILTASGIHVGAEGYIWTATVVLPINSALNPLLYTVGSVRGSMREKWLVWKEARRAKRSTELRQSNRNYPGVANDDQTAKGTSTNTTKM